MQKLKKFLFATAILAMMGVSALCKSQPYFYQIKIYHLQNQAQEAELDKFLESAYLPALHRTGIASVGVFKPIEPANGDRLVYVFIPFKSIGQFVDIDRELQNDRKYLQAGADYLNATPGNPPYERMESILLKAFSDSPVPEMPTLQGPKQERIYELRSYESATEKYFQNKVEMFNAGGEIDIFSRLDFNAIFYGEVLAGSKMPNLMYMTSFNNRKERDQKWKAFGEDKAWIKLRDDAEYQNNVSKADIFLLRATDYSDY